MVMLVRLVQSAKAACPILVMLLGIIIPASAVQPKKAPSGIVVIVLPERSRLTYLPADFIASAIFSIISSFAFMAILIGLSGLFADWLLRYAVSSSTLLIFLPPLVCATALLHAENISAIIRMTIVPFTLVFFMPKAPLVLGTLLLFFGFY